MDSNSRKILHELDLDSRKSSAIIAKNLGISPRTVARKVDQLMSSGVIGATITVTDPYKLGLTPWKIFLELQNTSRQVEQKIMKYLSDQKNICVSKTHIKSSSSSYHHMVNEYTKLDPTLPRIKNIPCPNVSCPSKNNGESKDSTPVDNDIIYLRYDDNNLKYVYICANCNTVWKTTNN